MSAEQVISLAERLKARREELGMSQAQAARELDVARTAYRLWEMEAARPAPDRWRLISRWLGVSVTTMLLAEELLSDEEASMSAGLEAEYRSAAGDWDQSAAANPGDFFAQARELLAHATASGQLGTEDAANLGFLISRIEEKRQQQLASVPWEEAELRKNLRPTKDAPRLARKALAGAAVDIPDDELYSARLLTSELVTNSVVHGAHRPADSIRLSVDVNRARLRVEVSERANGKPELKEPSELGGYGLALVESIASRWGTESDGDRNVTWFELDLPSPGA